MASSRLYQCKNSKDNFCFVCGLFTSSTDRREATDEIRVAYFDYFNLHVNQDKSYILKSFCSACRTGLLRWMKDESHLKFGRPMLWREAIDHDTNCYFCCTNLHGVTMAKRYTVQYANVSSVTKTIQHDDQLPVPIPKIRIQRQQESQFDTPGSNASSGNIFTIPNKNPILFTQFDLNDFARDLNLSKSTAEFMASRLLDRNMLAPGEYQYLSFKL